MTSQTLRSLASLITDSISKIELACATKNVKLPSLDEPFSPQSEAPLMNPEISEAASIIIAAASQLIATVRPAPMGLLTTAMQFHLSSALRVAVETNVVEILREAGPQGLHIDDISARNNTDPSKLGRVLRLLATEHIFKEVSPDVFANNRISSASDTGKPVKDLFERPEEKYPGTSGISAAISHFTDDQLKSSAYLLEAFTDPNYAKNEDPSHTAFNKAFQTDLPIFTWFEQPGNESRLQRFGIVFEVGSRLYPPNAILDGYDWGALPKGSTVVDVGGGIGTQSLLISKAFPDLKLVVQDREAVIPDGIKFQYYEASAPELLTSGRVSLQPHDFYAEQPIKNARVYFMRMIMHDWPDSTCVKILKHLRVAAGEKTELIIIENLMDYACQDTTIDQSIPGMESKVAPAPLLPNNGHAQVFAYYSDLQMICSLNGRERTPAQFREILLQAGWEMTSIYRAPVGHHKIIARIA
ncbi:S-adenosyl-L-methionine-dependent methyltransferase [Pholiota conissans]|uniref:S-adenosyl-L-methionine-dependent methyltransferase n=1 Tax=Pholiota conissans TaxID=109636 RepID=A0A9P5YMT8_9AGAR|nr:S-adenosyl-L-methionine-dependent methyltransferase [Pholiota conissans]